MDYVKEYINKNIGNPQLCVGDISENCGYNPDYLGRRFKQATGTTVVSYITFIRINQACRLLAGTELTVEEIAKTVGFTTPNYFCFVFKKQMEATPVEYRMYFEQSNVLEPTQ